MSEINNYDPNPYDDVTIDEALAQIYDRVNDRTIRQIVTILKKVIDGISTGKQDAIDSSHKLSADFIDDTGATNKFATEEELEQIETNETNISLLQQQVGYANTELEGVL
jgi:hypothetical protein